VPGRVIFLLGTSSVGKTSTVEALQDLLTEPYLEFGLDVAFGMVPARWGSAGGPASGGFWYEQVTDAPPTSVIRYGPVGARVLAGTRSAVEGLLEAGNIVLIDEMPLDSLTLDAWRQSLATRDVLWVRLVASPEILQRNEDGRAKTHRGLALGHALIADAADWVDLTLDSGRLNPRARAEAIFEAVERREE
jgi:chloramphenicol 3-O phosphotransferase